MRKRKGGVSVIVRDWQDGDTETAQAWFRDDPDLWAAIGYDAPLTAEAVAEVITARRAGGDIAAIEADGALIAMITIRPRLSATTGVVHLTIAPYARGHAIAIANAAFGEARQRGYTHLLAPAAPQVPAAIHQRWLRSMGFTVRHYGEWHA